MQKQSIKFLATGLAIFILGISFYHVTAQDTTKVKKWNFLAEPYIMFPYMNGETGIGNNISVPIDASAGDIFNNLKMAAMLNFEARTEKWAITSDFVYMSLKQGITPGTVIESGEVSAKELIWETAGLYRIVPSLELGIGGRLVNLDMGIDFTRNAIVDGSKNFNASGSKTWFDPLLIARLTEDINEKWLFQFRGDLGGFGVGSDFTWQIQAYTGYRFTKVFQLTAGYRILGIDYDNGTNADRFVYNVDTSGPVIRFGFNF